MDTSSRARQASVQAGLAGPGPHRRAEGRALATVSAAAGLIWQGQDLRNAHDEEQPLDGSEELSPKISVSQKTKGGMGSVPDERPRALTTE